MWCMENINLDRRDEFDEKKVWFELLQPWLNPEMWQKVQEMTGEEIEGEGEVNTTKKVNDAYEEKLRQLSTEERAAVSRRVAANG